MVLRIDRTGFPAFIDTTHPGSTVFIDKDYLPPDYIVPVTTSQLVEATVLDPVRFLQSHRPPDPREFWLTFPTDTCRHPDQHLSSNEGTSSSEGTAPAFRVPIKILSTGQELLCDHRSLMPDRYAPLCLVPAYPIGPPVGIEFVTVGAATSPILEWTACVSVDSSLNGLCFLKVGDIARFELRQADQQLTALNADVSAFYTTLNECVPTVAMVCPIVQPAVKIGQPLPLLLDFSSLYAVRTSRTKPVRGIVAQPSHLRTGAARQATKMNPKDLLSVVPPSRSSQVLALALIHAAPRPAGPVASAPVWKVAQDAAPVLQQSLARLLCAALGRCTVDRFFGPEDPPVLDPAVLERPPMIRRTGKASRPDLVFRGLALPEVPQATPVPYKEGLVGKIESIRVKDSLVLSPAGIRGAAPAPSLAVWPAVRPVPLTRPFNPLYTHGREAASQLIADISSLHTIKGALKGGATKRKPKPKPEPESPPPPPVSAPSSQNMPDRERIVRPEDPWAAAAGAGGGAAGAAAAAAALLEEPVYVEDGDISETPLIISSVLPVVCCPGRVSRFRNMPPNTHATLSMAIYKLRGLSAAMRLEMVATPALKATTNKIKTALKVVTTADGNLSRRLRLLVSAEASRRAARRRAAAAAAATTARARAVGVEYGLRDVERQLGKLVARRNELWASAAAAAAEAKTAVEVEAAAAAAVGAARNEAGEALLEAAGAVKDPASIWDEQRSLAHDIELIEHKIRELLSVTSEEALEMQRSFQSLEQESCSEYSTDV